RTVAVLCLDRSGCRRHGGPEKGTTRLRGLDPRRCGHLDQEAEEPDSGPLLGGTWGGRQRPLVEARLVHPLALSLVSGQEGSWDGVPHQERTGARNG